MTAGAASAAEVGGAVVASQREAARRLGVSHTALQKAHRAGRIAPEPGGGWDVAKLRARLAATADLARGAPPQAHAARASAEPADAPPAEPAASTAGGAAAAAASFHGARTANEVLKAQERRLRLDERRGRLVDRARALLLVRRLAREERDALLSWPSRVAAEVAAELGVEPHRLQLLLEARLRGHLAERAGAEVAVA